MCSMCATLLRPSTLHLTKGVYSPVHQEKQQITGVVGTKKYAKHKWQLAVRVFNKMENFNGHIIFALKLVSCKCCMLMI